MGIQVLFQSTFRGALIARRLCVFCNNCRYIGAFSILYVQGSYSI